MNHSRTRRPRRRRAVRALGSALVWAMLLAACSDDSGTTASDSTTTAPADDTTTTTPDETTTTLAVSTTTEVTGPSPGVTDDEIVIGITYVDTEALLAVNLVFELGDHEAVYQALIDDINAAGGIHGRQLRAVFAPIDPTNNLSADEVCIELTENQEVFLVTGFFLADAVLCPVDLQATAVVGGGMTPERLARAQAPWVTPLPDTDQPVQVLRTLAAGGELDGSVAVYAAAADSETMDDLVLPTLAELGIEPVATGINDATPEDVVTNDANVNVIAERFEADGADTVLIVGASGATWPQYVADDDSYRPTLLFLDITAARAYATSGATTDTTILQGSRSGGGFGPDQARYEEAAMQECVATLSAAGIDTPAPDDFPPDDTQNQPYQAAFQACPDMVLVRALVEAAGPNLNYGTLATGADGLEVTIPGDPTPRIYGPPPAADGDPNAYLFGWDEATKDFVLVES